LRPELLRAPVGRVQDTQSLPLEPELLVDLGHAVRLGDRGVEPVQASTVDISASLVTNWRGGAPARGAETRRLGRIFAVTPATDPAAGLADPADCLQHAIGCAGGQRLFELAVNRLVEYVLLRRGRAGRAAGALLAHVFAQADPAVG